MPTLPPLRDEPTRYPGCCLSLSNRLLATIGSLLNSSHDLVHPTSLTHNEPALVLSIGSGTGLLEELLHAYLNNLNTHTHVPEERIKSWRVEGVEVNPAVNTHLPEDRINYVAGTWAVLSTRAREATALMFVYPRDGALVRRYVEAFMGESKRHPLIASENLKGGRNGVQGGEEKEGEGRVRRGARVEESGLSSGLARNAIGRTRGWDRAVPVPMPLTG
ncbi:hypothetical protein O1611_g4655 [Lasiodiplodia mahajangana]|uniref:Uncharacterized protein n=1 Tax=Lasiodiplodia mahajangana TaxID=1108764 RepID=A0ACC2JN78_9PEZI|nr:hypothetical protein O1611_g4655 [Lasiodiplodia mahajangana]